MAGVLCVAVVSVWLMRLRLKGSAVALGPRADLVSSSAALIPAASSTTGSACIRSGASHAGLGDWRVMSSTLCMIDWQKDQSGEWLCGTDDRWRLAWMSCIEPPRVPCRPQYHRQQSGSCQVVNDEAVGVWH